jgi:general stress protein YciG
MAQRKNPHAVALRKLAGSKPGKARAANLTAKQLSAIGRKGGKIGGKARAAALTPEQRSESARKAAAKRWGKKN